MKNDNAILNEFRKLYATFWYKTKSTEALIDAAENNNLDQVEELLKQGKDVNLKSPFGLMFFSGSCFKRKYGTGSMAGRAWR